MNNPSEIAREALRQMAMQRIPPTPDNYRVHYAKISGSHESAGFDPLRQLGRLVAVLPKNGAAEEKLAALCAQALEKQRWEELVALLTKAMAHPQTGSSLPWNKLIERLARQIGGRTDGLSPAQKQIALEKVLGQANTSDRLFEKLNSLLLQWSERTSADASGQDEGAAPPLVSGAAAPEAAAIQETCANLLETVVASALADSTVLVDEILDMAKNLRRLSPDNAGDLLSGLRKLAVRIEYHIEDQQELKTGLIHLLQLMVDNIGELVIDDQWLSGQLELLRSIVAQPLNIRTIDNAERRLKEVVFKQSHLKRDLVEAQSTIKALLAGFVDQLSSFAQSTGAYHDKIDLCARRISEATDIRQLEGVINDVMRETRTIQHAAQRTYDELAENRNRVIAAENRVTALEKELASTSEMMRHDPLTGALNRRGLEEIFEKELARANRQQKPLCLGLLDIDNFKKLNDLLGHDAGDTALANLVGAARHAMRPQDTIARYGGEEFVILLPDTELEEGRTVLVRVQRELTKHFFMHQNQKVLVTFSAGVTQLPPGETREQAIKRADELMYRAKHSGKNKVVAA